MMNNQKDVKKTDVKYPSINNVSDIRALSNKSIYDFVNKKTEKLVIALYLVSDCMDVDDALKNRIRLLGVELLSDIHKLSTLTPTGKRNHIDVSLSHIYELLSFIEIAYNIGFISEMNTSILKNEFSILAMELKSSQSEDKHFTFSLDHNMFDIPKIKEEDYYKNGSIDKGQISVKDKRTPFNTKSVIDDKSPLYNSHSKRTKNSFTSIADREDRTNKIISIIKDMSDIGKKDVSIKDISMTFTDYSEKTIQRELNNLVTKGRLKKTGSKRWSRYSII